MTSPIELTIKGHVATILIRRPPHNFVDVPTITALADTLCRLDNDLECRSVVLASVGKSFCAGADFSAIPSGGGMIDPAEFYAQAIRLFRNRKPLVAAIQGAAVGAGAGLALCADFRVVSENSGLSVNFNSLGFHPGFGLSVTLPNLIGTQLAARLFYLGERIDGRRMVEIGLADELVAVGTELETAQRFAAKIAKAAPLAVVSTRETLRLGLADKVQSANARELIIQKPQFATADFREGVRAFAERREPVFIGR